MKPDLHQRVFLFFKEKIKKEQLKRSLNELPEKNKNNIIAYYIKI